MQSFASPPHNPHTNPTPIPPPPHKNHAPHQKGATIAHTHALSTQKSIERAQISPIPAPFLPKIHRKGATIAYTHALSTKKSIERAQLSLVLAKNITIFAKKQINHNYYDKQRINRKSL